MRRTYAVATLLVASGAFPSACSKRESSSGGEVRVALAPPVKIYTRSRGDLSRVTDNAFVGALREELKADSA